MVRTKESLKMNLNTNQSYLSFNRSVRKNRFVAALVCITVLTSLTGCSSQAGTDSSGKPSTKKRELTIVTGDQATKVNHEIAVNRIHRLDGANLEKWLSADEVQIMVTTLKSKATATKEATYNYNWFKVDLKTGRREPIPASEGLHNQTEGTVVNSHHSPDGKYSFIQTWRDKYTADNAIKNLATDETIPISVSNYLEVGGWLNENTYILAAGSMENKGDIWQISTDGTKQKVELEDNEVENFNEFAVGEGFIYYKDKEQRLKRFSPTVPKPTVLAPKVYEFSLSPDAKQIAASIAEAGKAQSDLMLYDTKGNAQGLFLAKGDLLSYFSWSPDSSKLAFATYSENKSGMNGVYIFDSTTGKVSPLGLSYYPTYPLSWSPDGTKLGITADDPNSLTVTQIVEFK
jgi:hypothetical protein